MSVGAATATVPPPTGAAAELRPFRDGRRAVRLLAPFALLVTAFIINQPYLTAGFVEDDLTHLVLVSRFWLGRIGFGEYLLTPHNEHLLPAWRLWFYLEWRCFGLNPIPWHCALVLVQATAALLVFKLVDRFLDDPIGAGVAGLLWSAAAFTRWDNPLVWISASHLSFALTAFLASMFCLAHRGAERQEWWWALGMGLGLSASILTMSVMLFLAPILWLQDWLLRAPGATGRPGRAWIAAWFLPVVALGGLQLWARWHFAFAGSAPVTIHPLRLALAATALHATAVLELFWPVDKVPSFEFLVSASGLALLGLFFLRWLTPPARQLVVVAFALSLLYSALLGAARAAQFSIPQLVYWSRYRFVPSLAWCVLLGVLSHQWLRSNARPRRRWKLVLLAGLLLLIVGRERQLAQAGKQDFVHFLPQRKQTLAEQRRLLDQLAARAVQDGVPLRLLDLPVGLPPVVERLSEFIGWTHPGGLAPIQLVSATAYTEVDRDHAQKRLAAIENPAAARMQALLADVYGYGEVFLWISQYGMAKQQPFRLPSVVCFDPPFPTRALMETLFPQGLLFVEVVPRAQLNARDVQALRQLRTAAPAVHARRLARLLGETDG